jgi:hypothetical protein
VDFSHNAMRRLAERLFDGMEDTLEEIYLRKGGMGTKNNLGLQIAFKCRKLWQT